MTNFLVEMLNKLKRNDLCWCGSGKKYRKCHLDFDERIGAIKFDSSKGQIRPPHKLINNARQVSRITGQFN